MAYVKQNWQCGETITADKLNHMEDGIASGGDAGYECTETKTTLTEESVTTVAQGLLNRGELSYSQIIDAETIFVTFNGTEYECARIDDGTGNYAYGGIGQQGLDFSVYPFAIALMGGSVVLITETAGTYAIKIETVGETITTTPCFEKAVKSVLSAPLRLVPGVTTKAEAVEAFSKGLMMYFINTDNTPNGYEFITTFSPELGNMNSAPGTNIISIGFSEEDNTFYYATR